MTVTAGFSVEGTDDQASTMQVDGCVDEPGWNSLIQLDGPMDSDELADDDEANADDLEVNPVDLEGTADGLEGNPDDLAEANADDLEANADDLEANADDLEGGVEAQAADGGAFDGAGLDAGAGFSELSASAEGLTVADLSAHDSAGLDDDTDDPAAAYMMQVCTRLSVTTSLCLSLCLSVCLSSVQPSLSVTTSIMIVREWPILVTNKC